MAFVDRHWKSKDKLFDIGKPVLVFQKKIGASREVTIQMDWSILDCQYVQRYVPSRYISR